MAERELCPLCGVPLDDEPGPMLEGDCPVHGVIGRLRGVDDFAPKGLLGQEADSGLSVWSADFDETLPVGTAGWRRVDAFPIAEAAETRGFEITGELDSFRSNQKLRYPDGTVVDAQGMAHEGGQARWRVTGLQPGYDTLLIERTDVMYAGGDIRLEVDGAHGVVFPDFAPDRRYRARNRAVPIPGGWITGETAVIGMGRIESTKDLSHFEVWVYQSRTPAPEPLGPDDAPMETVDVPASALVEPPAPAPLGADDPVDALDDGSAAPDAGDAFYAPDAGDDADDLSGADSVDFDPPDADPLDDPGYGDVEDALDDSVVDPASDDGETGNVALLADASADDGMAAHFAMDDLADHTPPAAPADAAVDAPEAPAIPTPERDPDPATAPAPAAADPEPAEPAHTLPEHDEPPAAQLAAVQPAAAQPAARPPGAGQIPATASAVARDQKLVTITLADAEHGHGTAHAHLAGELAAGWRIERLECLPGPRGGWLVVLLVR